MYGNYTTLITSVTAGRKTTIYQGASKLLTTMARTDGKNVKRCKKCNKAFSTQLSLNRHLIERHLQHRDYHCNHCVYVAIRSSDLDKHTLRKPKTMNNKTLMEHLKNKSKIMQLIKQEQWNPHVPEYQCSTYTSKNRHQHSNAVWKNRNSEGSVFNFVTI